MQDIEGLRNLADMSDPKIRELIDEFTRLTKRIEKIEAWIDLWETYDSEWSEYRRRMASQNHELERFSKNMRKQMYKNKKRTCSLCKPHKRGKMKRWTPKEIQEINMIHKELSELYG